MNPSLRDLLQHTAALRRLASDLVGADAADDVLQEAAIEALRRGYDSQVQARSWWFGVVRNLAGKRRRTEAVRRRHELAAAPREDAYVDANADAADSLRWLSETLTTLPEPYRSTLLGRYLRDLSPSELAAERGEPLRTIKTRLQRGLGLLRERFDARGSDWRAGLVMAFGLKSALLPVASSTKALVGGAILMHVTSKWVVASVTAVLLVSGLFWFAPWREVATQQPVARVERPDVAKVEPGNQDGVDAVVVGEAVASPPLRREPVAQAAADVAVAASDQIILLVHDAEHGTPIEDYALRRHCGT